MVRQLQHWWRGSLEKGKGKEVVSNGVGEIGNVNGHVNGKGKGVITSMSSKNMAKRGGKKANINRTT